MIRIYNYFFVLTLVITFFSCNKKTTKQVSITTKLYQQVNPEISGIQFTNFLIENDSINYFTYPYIFMGGGVAIGDINNDGLQDIFFTGNMVSNKLFLNKGELKFEDISKEAGLE